MIFWKLPQNKFMAFIPRTGSTAWGQEILDTFYPMERIKQERASGSGELCGPQYFIPFEKNVPKDSVIVAIIRNPIERFRSGFSRASQGKTVDELIESFSGRREVNIHIRRIAPQVSGLNIKWFRHEDQLQELADEIQMLIPPARNKSGSGEKPDLTSEQITKLTEYYSDDFTIWNNAKK